MSEAINLGEKLEFFDEHWKPKAVAHLNWPGGEGFRASRQHRAARAAKG
jgi:hypothetical protein